MTCDENICKQGHCSRPPADIFQVSSSPQQKHPPNLSADQYFYFYHYFTNTVLNPRPTNTTTSPKIILRNPPDNKPCDHSTGLCASAQCEGPLPPHPQRDGPRHSSRSAGIFFFSICSSYLRRVANPRRPFEKRSSRASRVVVHFEYTASPCSESIPSALILI